MLSSAKTLHLLPATGRFYKANLHTHTVVSDGSRTPEQMRDHYRAHGYQIVAFTDHDLCLAHPQLRTEDFLPLTGYEMSIHSAIPCLDWHKVCHLSYLSKQADQTAMVCHDRRFFLRAGNTYKYEDQMKVLTEEQREYSQEFIQHAIDEGNKHGFLVILNHPVWSMQTYEEYAHLKGLWGIEVYNHGSAVIGSGDNNDRAFEDLLWQGEFPIPVAADDSHSEKSSLGGWMMICAEKLEYGAVIEAMEKGDLYASIGPEIHRLTVENGQLCIETSPCQRIFLLTETRYCARIIAKDEPLTEGKIDLTQWYEKVRERSAENAYIRIRVEDGQGNCAYTRAYRAEELAGAF